MEKKIIEWDYVFHHEDPDSFKKIINSKISEGWQPLGGIFVKSYVVKHQNGERRVDYLYQAIVRYSNE